MSDFLFALDIGTRSVVGLLMKKDGDEYKLLDHYTVEHEERSMLDGQIHDIVSVSRVIQQVKKLLEEKHQIELHKVCVAAAGRALKTKRVEATKNITKQPLMDEEDIRFLELEAVQKAQFDLASDDSEENSTDYYCVGYSVLHYQLDQEEIGSLIDQQGDKASVEIIATFLPKVVVESLLSALKRSGLQLEALTLEPIAAIHILIPASMRRLNVALVDIGAGTSDIALTSEGTITAYGMVPKAGDEITEAISDHYLLDFNQAEELKKEITTNYKATVTDILGFEQEVPYDELVCQIKPTIDELATAIAEEIIELNGLAPKAVMLVGGGSQTPELTKRLALKLHLPFNRVAIRGVDAIQGLIKQEGLPIGPEYITPIGIAIAAKQNPVHYLSVIVNGRVLRLFEMKQLTVGDSLLAAGIEVQKLYGRPGMAYMIHFNGQQVTLPGSFGTAPNITLNDEPVTIDSVVKDGDMINVTKGKDGESPQYTIEEFIGETTPITISLNDTTYAMHPTVQVNNHEVPTAYLLKDGDHVTFNKNIYVRDFLDFINVNTDMNQPFSIYANDKLITYQEWSQTLKRNGNIINDHTILNNSDQLTIESGFQPTVLDLLKMEQRDYEIKINITYNQKPLTLSKPILTVFRNGKKLSLDDPIYHQDSLQIVKEKESPFIFQDIFRFISLDLQNVKGRVEMTRNGEDVTFFDQLFPNDSIEITFESIAEKH
ncbi:cell division protein FtsA [Gracilibacillus sp. YIM 98692]|uniref:cell division protein FtsA n=1 Tax=Gracilibacillus sp. YIM 98692 TaxID=2663532 RepID=UPI0013D18337|nr:cell division protein FtsA [Gracilibacillus sp. YIM 98692]